MTFFGRQLRANMDWTPRQRGLVNWTIALTLVYAAVHGLALTGGAWSIGAIGTLAPTVIAWLAILSGLPRRPPPDDDEPAADAPESYRRAADRSPPISDPAPETFRGMEMVLTIYVVLHAIAAIGSIVLFGLAWFLCSMH